MRSTSVAYLATSLQPRQL